MSIFLKIIFFGSLLAVVVNHLLYPVLIIILKAFSKKEPQWQGMDDEKPEVHILFAAYNEESVIEEKIHSSFRSNYPTEKIRITVGSDCSNDKTEEIVSRLKGQYPNLHLIRFTERQGKASILNQISVGLSSPYLILTDANIIFGEDTIPQLVSAIHQQSNTGAVGGTIEYRKIFKKGISAQENFYLKLENKVKTAESRLFGAAMGLEGGCYIIRRELFPQIPRLFFMEDFYVTLYLLEKGYAVKFNEEALCYEDVSVANTQEFKRKKRISIGNFQNLSRFANILWRKPFPVGFVFFNHKILRWFTPLFLILIFITSIILIHGHEYFNIFAGLFCLSLAAGLFGILLARSRLGSWLKYPGHFMYMNIALLWGMIVYLRGVKSNVWEPTKRNQQE